jgi:hypothetical protein
MRIEHMIRRHSQTIVATQSVSAKVAYTEQVLSRIGVAPGETIQEGHLKEAIGKVVQESRLAKQAR